VQDGGLSLGINPTQKNGGAPQLSADVVVLQVRFRLADSRGSRSLFLLDWIPRARRKQS